MPLLFPAKAYTLGMDSDRSVYTFLVTEGVDTLIKKRSFLTDDMKLTGIFFWKALKSQRILFFEMVYVCPIV